MKWRLALLVIVMLTVTMPAMAAKPQPPIERLEKVTPHRPLYNVCLTKGYIDLYYTGNLPAHVGIWLNSCCDDDCAMALTRVFMIPNTTRRIYHTGFTNWQGGIEIAYINTYTVWTPREHDSIAELLAAFDRWAEVGWEDCGPGFPYHIDTFGCPRWPSPYDTLALQCGIRYDDYQLCMDYCHIYNDDLICYQACEEAFE